MIRDVKAAALDWLRLLPLFAGFVGLYVALDKVSFGHPLFGLNITPWNPAPALGLVLVMRFGQAAWPALALAVVLAEIFVHGSLAPGATEIVSGLLLAGGYALLGQNLANRLPRDALLDDRRTLVAWLVRVAIGSLIISLLYLFSLRAFGVLAPSGWWPGLKHLWVGDGVGIVVMMPLLLWLTSKRGRRRLRRSIFNREAFGYLLLGVASLWLAFGVGGHSGFKLFYLLFLPIIWAAGRHGMAGAIVCAAGLQVGVIVAMRVLQYSAVTVAELQILAMAMAVVGFFIGAVVNEQRRTNDDLRHSLRLAAAGEMAGALAHELHHPLTALSAYAGACERLVERGETGEQLQAAVRCVKREAVKAGEVVRRLQDFFRTGEPQPESVRLADLVEAAVAPYRVRAEQAGIRLRVAAMPEVTLLVDRLQMEVVLRSLLANAFESVADSPRQPRRVWVAAWKEGTELACLRVEDSGQGLSPERVNHLFEPQEAISDGGRGFGLAISRAIVATHGGRLWGEVANHGIFKIELPIIGSDGLPPPTEPVFSESDI